MNYKNNLFSKKRKAFTLIELLIVIAIIGILFIVLVSKVDFATDKAKATGVQTDFRSFQVAIESVAKENEGLATFGWDTGDTNGDRVRNSYDKGDVNKNGKQDSGEVFVGSKTYSETWTGIYTLTNPADANDKSAIVALEEAINKNLDPKLHITIHDDLTITMANGAQDPWDTEYHGYYITNATVDSKDRGAIVIYSNGANQEFGSEHNIAGGVVTVNVPGNNVYGKDDYSLAVVYTYVNSYGEVKTTTTGFSNNQGGGQAGTDGTFVPGNGGSGDTPSNSDPLQEVAGLYDANDQLIAGMSLLLNPVEEGGYGMDIEKNYTYSSWKTDTSSPYYLLTNDETLKNGVKFIIAGPTKIGDYAFKETALETVIFGDSVLEIGKDAFEASLLKTVDFNEKTHTINSYAFYSCSNLSGTIELPKNLKTMGSNVFRNAHNVNNMIIYNNLEYAGVQNFGSEDMNGLTYTVYENCKYLGNADNPYVVLAEGPAKYASTSELKIHEQTRIIGGHACYMSYITTLNIPNSVIQIGDAAFYGSHIRNLTFGTSVKYIGSGSFIYSYCKEIFIPNSVEAIYSCAFGDSSIQTMHFGNGIKTIETDLFRFCEDLATIYIPDLVKWIDISFEKGQYGGNPLGDATTIYINGQLPETIDFVAPESINHLNWGLSTLKLNSITINAPVEIVDEDLVSIPEAKTIIFNNNVIVDDSWVFNSFDVETLIFNGSITKLDGSWMLDSSTIKTLIFNCDEISSSDGRLLYNCKNLESITFNSSTVVTQFEFDSSCSVSKIYVPADLIEQYKTQWKADYSLRDYVDMITAMP